MDPRPRDALGRPLPRDANPSVIVPGPGYRDDLTDEEAWRLGMSYLDQGLPFHAHEVFEMRWRSAPGPSRQAWRAMAQWGAALTHAARGNVVGAQRVAARAAFTLGHAPSVPPCIDAAAVMRSCSDLAGGETPQ